MAQSEAESAMPDSREGELFPVTEPDRSTGLLPSQMLRGAVRLGHELQATVPIGDDQIQPASLDLRLGEVAYRVRASFLPGSTTVAQRIDELKLHEFALTDGAVL